MKSLCSIVDEAAAEVAEKPLFVFPENRWAGEDVLTYGDLAARSGAAARAIEERARPGDRALLLFPIGAAFWEAFVGCLAAGVVAVPLKIPNLNRSSEHLQQVCRDCAPSVLLTDKSTAELLGRRADKHPLLSRLPVVTPTQWQSQECAFCYVKAAGESLAFLQYTSGSTANPKGVQISHGNLLANLAMIRDRMEIRTGEDSAVTWLPHYHDMGLVGSYLTALYTKITSWCMQPEDFALRPARWLELISAHRASICGGPDFAFRLCAEKILDEQMADVDLSSWRIAYIGSERIRSETLRRFTERFSPLGFRRNAFFPCYGMGEVTLMATGGPPEAAPAVRQLSSAGLMANRVDLPASAGDSTALVGCGHTFDGCRVDILNIETGMPLADDEIGEVHLSGPSVTEGYYNRGDLNGQVFRELIVDGRPLRFLKTGDLGFLSEGELFITGRIKEIIIVRGRNLSPEDIEQQIENAHDALQPGGAVAFSTDRNGEESLVIATELKRVAMNTESPEIIVAAVRNRVVEAFGVNPAEILLLQPASIPRTSSGKLKRLAVRDSYRLGRIDRLVD